MHFCFAYSKMINLAQPDTIDERTINKKNLNIYRIQVRSDAGLYEDIQYSGILRRTVIPRLSFRSRIMIRNFMTCGIISPSPGSGKIKIKWVPGLHPSLPL